MAHHLTTCTFCGVGCGLYLETSGNQVVGVYPSISHPTNRGRICVRGWHVHEVASSPDRLKTPLVKKNGDFQKVSWDEALNFIADRLTEVRALHGPDAIAFLNSPRCSNEEAYLLQKFARAVIGTNNVDHGAGLYGNNSINVLLEMTGVPATTNSIEELSGSEVILVDSVDLGRRMPTIAGIVIRAKLNGSQLIVVGTRRHRVAESADIFLQIRPDTETLLFGAMAKVIVDRGLANLPFIKARSRDYEAFLARVHDYDLLQVAEACGVQAEHIETAALMYARAGCAAALYSASMEERSQDSIRALVNLALLTGNLGRQHAGIYALAEQNNLQGVCDMGVLTDRLPGYRPVADPAARASLEKIWKTTLPSGPGLDARSVLNNCDGKVKALWLCRYDPSSTMSFDVSSLGRLEFVVAQHLFMTESLRYADVILPTTAYGEERVSFTSTDRRIQLAEQVVEPVDGLMPAWAQLTALARKMGADWGYQSSSDVMAEIASVVSFYSGATHENLARDYGRQWPCTEERPLGTRYLFGEHTGNAEFRFAPVARPAAPGLAVPEYPLALVFGSSLFYWNQSVLIRHSETLKREYRILSLDYPEGFVEINNEDAKRAGIRDGERIRLSVDGASAVSTARVTPEVRSGTVFVPYFLPEIEKQLRGATRNGRLVPVRIEKEAA
jgi:predicted molibdopterin-dependent oxidoreductase YjgC